MTNNGNGSATPLAQPSEVNDMAISPGESWVLIKLPPGGLADMTKFKLMIFHSPDLKPLDSIKIMLSAIAGVCQQVMGVHERPRIHLPNFLLRR